MELGKKTNKELKAVLDEMKVEYSDTDIKKNLVKKIEDAQKEQEAKQESHEVEEEVEEKEAEEPVGDLVNENVEDLVDSENKPFKALYKAKQRWIPLGTFKTKEEMLRALNRKGSKEYKIE